MMKCCVNLDWLQCRVEEPQDSPRGVLYFERAGYKVVLRDYGTPLYREMFTIYQDGEEFIEVRRDPISRQSDGGILSDNSMHLRLCNRTCYFEDAIQQLRQFCLAHNLYYMNLSRVDICCDFNEFLHGDNPRNFIQSYLEGRYCKTRITQIAAHGQDSDTCRIWNSISWASKTSVVRTKLYNKSIEMRQVKRKPYIIDHWRAAGLDVNRDVWRVEFSIGSQMNSLMNAKTKEFTEVSLNSYDTREKLWYMFHLLASRYFHFKHVRYDEKGTMIRKARLPDKILFSYKDMPDYVMPAHLTAAHDPNRTDRMIIRRLENIATDNDLAMSFRVAAWNIIRVFDSMVMRKKWIGRPLTEFEQKEFYPKKVFGYDETWMIDPEKRKELMEIVNQSIDTKIWDELPF